jgi:hypothetical protein
MVLAVQKVLERKRREMFDAEESEQLDADDVGHEYMSKSAFVQQC